MLFGLWIVNEAVCLCPSKLQGLVTQEQMGMDMNVTGLRSSTFRSVVEGRRPHFELHIYRFIVRYAKPCS